MKTGCILGLLICIIPIHAQLTINTQHNMSDHQPNTIVYNRLYQYGIADAFVGGLYRGTLPLEDLKRKGDFGLGAPDLVDGELTMYDGRFYQTKATGNTAEPDGHLKTSLFFITFFKPEIFFSVNSRIDEKSLQQRITDELKHKNNIYAIKVSGKFSRMVTRAFPPMEKEPFPPLSSVANTQNVFDFSDEKGILVGYYIPDYLNGINVKGFHFHYLSEDRKHGGHVLAFTGEHLNIEIAEMKSFELETSKDDNFQNFKFKTQGHEDLEQIEQRD